jgi:hypothetical protein
MGVSEVAGSVSIVEPLFLDENIAATSCIPALLSGTRYSGRLHAFRYSFHYSISSKRTLVSAVRTVVWQ